MTEILETGKVDWIRKLASRDGNSKEIVLSLELDSQRYEWREVNWESFLYDKLEDIYLPEAVYLDLLSSLIRKNMPS
ncbi:MAG: hypothetical protein ACE14T_08435 [Syntrophales bacterium]